MLPAFDIRLVGYIPGGARFTEGEAVIPASGINYVGPGTNVPTLSFSVSEAVYTTLPEFLEVAVEHLDPALGPVGAFGNPLGKWVEGENCRFLVNGETYDDTDVAGMHSLTTVNVWRWWGSKTDLSGVAPFAVTGLNTEAAKTLTGVTSSGTTLTKTAHGLANGDQVRLTLVGTTKPTGLTVGTSYWVRDVTANTFKLAGASNEAAKTIGTASGMTFTRLRVRLLATNTPFVNNDKVTISEIGGIDAGFGLGDSFYVVRRTGTKFELSKSVGGDSIEIGTAGPLAMYRDTDGNRQFSAVTPGTVLKTAIDEEHAKTPPWAPFLTYDFTNTADSAGVAWPALTTQQLKPGTTIDQMIQLLVDQGWTDVATQGRTLRAFGPERGVDRTVGASPVRIGRNATSIPVRRSLDNLITHLTVRGEATIQLTLTNVAAPDELGRLSAYETLSGVVDTATATILGNQTLTKGGQVQTQYTVTEPAADADYLPFLHYQVGDWVQAWIGGEWKRLRVAEFVLSKDASGALSVSTVLNDVFTDVVARLLRKRVAAVGGTISGGSGTGVDENDTRKPKAPVGLVLDTVGSWAEDGSAVASVFATWSPVTQATDSTSIDVDFYELWLRPDGSNVSEPKTQSEDTTAGYGPLIAGRTYYAKVRARSRSDQYGEFSDEVGFVAAQPLEPLGPPDPPTVTTELGTVTVAWNGLIEGSSAPKHLRHVYAAISDAEGGTYTPVGQTMGNQGSTVITDLTIGQLYWFKLYPVDRLGVVGAASTAVSVTVQGIDLGSLDQDLQDLVTATGANPVVSATEPGPDKHILDLIWFDTSVPNAVVPTRWNGSQWEVIQYGADALGPNSVVADKIAANAVIAAKIAANAVTADKVQALAITTAKLAADAVTANKIAAGSVEANKIAAGAIQSQHINVGAKAPNGTPVNRVPAPITDAAYWGLHISGTTDLGQPYGPTLVTSTTGGLVATPTVGGNALMFITAEQPVPLSRKIAVTFVATVTGLLTIHGFDATATEVSVVTATSGSVYTFPDTAVSYRVRISRYAGSTAATLVAASVFEVIGEQSGQQRVEISPAGLRLTNSDGSGYIDLTTNTSQYFSIQKETNAGTGIYNSVMSIDSDGNISGNSLSSGSTVEIGGTDLMGSMDLALYEGNIGSLPYMDRVGWGEVYTRTFTYPTSINTQNMCIAEGYFTALEGRQYEIIVNAGKAEASNPTTENLRIELLVGPSPLSVTTSATTYVQTHFLVQNNSQLYPVPNLRTELKCIAGATDAFSEIPPGSTYWMLRWHFPNAMTGGPATVQSAATGNRIISIRDMGPVRSTISATNHATSGAQASVAPRRIDTFNATWSATWAGSTKLTGSTQYDNARSLYNGTRNGVILSSAVGFPALGLSGRTILKAEVWLKNRNSKYSTIEPDIGTASSTAEPATPPTRSNGFYTQFYRGDGRWVVLPSATYAGLANGTIRAVTVGYLNFPDDYGYFDGFGQADPPKLRITSEVS